MGRGVTKRSAGIGAVLAAALVTVSFSAGAASGAAPRLSGSITVSAASSLRKSFNKLATDFEELHKGTTINFNYGGSATLAAQIQSGAPVDAFASADLTNMDKLVATGFITATPRIFVRNSMEIAVKPGNPQHISLSNLATAGTIALCGASASCGVYAANVLARAKVTIPESSITRQPDAASTIAQVANGDAVAAIVYTSDVAGAGTTVTGIPIPAAQNVTAFYSIAPLAGSADPALAKAFVAYVTSPTGVRVLAQHGFRAPGPTT